MGNTKATKKEMIEEAIRRMEMIGVNQHSIKAFKRGLLPLHQVSMEDGNLRVQIGVATEDITNKVREFEEELNCLAYLLTVTETSMGTIINAFVVLPNKEEWEMAHLIIEEDENVATVAFNPNIPNIASFSVIKYWNFDGAIAKIL